MVPSAEGSKRGDCPIPKEERERQKRNNIMADIKIGRVIQIIEDFAPLSLQESYDNSGLIIGDKEQECKGILVALDLTEAVVAEACEKGINLIIAHHPILFKKINKINGATAEGRLLVRCIKEDITFYAVHTNLDKTYRGVSYKMAERIGLEKVRALQSEPHLWRKLATYVPIAQAEAVRAALFQAGAGRMGAYTSCSFNTWGKGTFLPLREAQPFIGQKEVLTEVEEIKIELIYPYCLESRVIGALRACHPYETPAFDIWILQHSDDLTGLGVVGELKAPMAWTGFLELLKTRFSLSALRHTKVVQPSVQRVALCGGSGAFLIEKAIERAADIYISADFKYHDFFRAEDRLMLCDIGHYESERVAIDLLYDLLYEKLPKFALCKTAVNTNPVIYFS